MSRMLVAVAVVTALGVGLVSAGARAESATVKAEATPLVTGTVKDKETGRALEEFTVRVHLRCEEPKWDSTEGKHTGGGGYAVGPLPDAKDVDLDAKGYFLRVEANGYMPQTSAVFQAWKPFVLDFALVRRRMAEGRVVNPDGSAASWADVYLAVEDLRLRVETTPKGTQTGRAMAKVVADEEGRFSFVYESITVRHVFGIIPVKTRQLRPDIGVPYLVVVMGEQGFAEVPEEAFTGKEIEIKLEPWGGVTGTVLRGLAPVANAEVYLSRQDGNDTNLATRYAAKAWTDAGGQFVLDRVAPGSYTVVLMPQDSGDYPRWVAWEREPTFGKAHVIAVEVKPGQVAAVTIGGTGRTVTGRFVVPEEEKHGGEVTVFVTLGLINAEGIPADVERMTPEEQQAWKEKWRGAGSADTRCTSYHGTRAGQDGAFTIEDVPPGRYRLGYMTLAPAETKGHATRLVQPQNSRIEIEVPAAPAGQSSEPFDIGVLDPRERMGRSLDPTAGER